MSITLTKEEAEVRFKIRRNEFSFECGKEVGKWLGEHETEFMAAIEVASLERKHGVSIRENKGLRAIMNEFAERIAFAGAHTCLDLCFTEKATH